VSQARTDDAGRRLATVPGIGSINATALVAAVGDGRAFARRRDMAAVAATLTSIHELQF
jgi:transposase